MSLSHVSKWVDNREVFSNIDGTTTTDREQAEIWMDQDDPGKFAKKIGAQVSDAYSPEDNDDIFDGDEPDYI